MTPLLLQKSGLTKNGIIGKYLHLHPVLGSMAIYDRDIHPTYGIPMSAYSHELKNITNKKGTTPLGAVPLYKYPIFLVFFVLP